MPANFLVTDFLLRLSRGRAVSQPDVVLHVLERRAGCLTVAAFRIKIDVYVQLAGTPVCIRTKRRDIMKRNRVEELLQRSERCCCKQCGGPLEPRIIVYNKYGGSGAELYCARCQKIEYGTEPEVYQAAKAFVDQVGFNHFVDLEENDRTYMLNIAKVCEILSWGSKYWGILGKRGFNVELQLPEPPEEE